MLLILFNAFLLMIYILGFTEKKQQHQISYLFNAFTASYCAMQTFERKNLLNCLDVLEFKGVYQYFEIRFK